MLTGRSLYIVITNLSLPCLENYKDYALIRPGRISCGFHENRDTVALVWTAQDYCTFQKIAYI